MLFKRQVAEEFPNVDVIAPQLPVYPEDAKKLITELVQQHKSSLIGVVGSSLGGYLATYLHNQFGLPIVVINPAVRPFELLADYLGDQVQPITGQSYTLTEAHMQELRSLYQPHIERPLSVWLLQQEEDEVLDYRQALEKYEGCHITFELGGNHGFEGFERFPVKIVNFLDEQTAE